ncbi:hypothetical protein GBA52_014654 [Prunus armeniaca]|nr:hypothetical protein GBA52_026232 [Prunus armeniaca]KAH0987477.1 hypothetical protein GBA52_014654 [Prunus armeniaca]
MKMWREVFLPLHVGVGTINNGLLRWKCWLLEPVGAGIDSEPSGALFGRLWKQSGVVAAASRVQCAVHA